MLDSILKTERIGNVTLDLEFYQGTDTYSDGDVEDKLLEIARTCDSEEALEEVIMKSNQWPILYHFSDIRKNVLSWYGFDKSASILEIGAGCGAITGLFCQRCQKVTAIDLSKRRSTINAHRNKAYDNLTIKVGNFEDIDLKGETFDYVSLIGVLEYSIYYIHSREPFLDMLKKCYEYLKPGGELFIAIENKYGIKYFAGAAEDHCGRTFEGIEGYPTAQKVRTFSRKGLENLVVSAGFSCDFYYPYPDYKMPLTVYSDDYLPKESDILPKSPSFDRQRVVLLDEEAAIREAIKEGDFPQISNSFIVVAKKS